MGTFWTEEMQKNIADRERYLLSQGSFPYMIVEHAVKMAMLNEIHRLYLGNGEHLEATSFLCQLREAALSYLGQVPETSRPSGYESRVEAAMEHLRVLLDQFPSKAQT